VIKRHRMHEPVSDRIEYSDSRNVSVSRFTPSSYAAEIFQSQIMTVDAKFPVPFPHICCLYDTHD
jgi:hypothetical protein